MTKKSNELLIFKEGEDFFTTSLDIAKNFGKRHEYVVKKIEDMDELDGFTAQTFLRSEFKDSSGRVSKMYNLNRDGFAFLAMGFTGKEAAKWKVKYIKAFNHLIKENQFLREQLLRNKSDDNTQLSRIEGKITRRALTDIIAIFIEYAREQGSSQPQMYYQVISKLSNRLFDFNESLRKNPHKRDYMESIQLKELDNIEEKLSQTILLGMKERIAYKSIYLLCKDKVERYIDIFGTSPVISQIEHTQYSLLN